jgi:Trypsin-co-occurring domain 1
MQDDINVGGIAKSDSPVVARKLVPIKVGDAAIYIEQVGPQPEVEPGDDIHPVALPTPQEAFERAGDFLHECVRIFDERIRALATKPREVAVEFSLAFQVKGKAHIIPVLLSGEAATQAGIKVSATWGPNDTAK